ncbi:GAF domain-containing protein [Dactylosporangium sp. NBC_01737]|uniref:GAF domain-containing sensor histidine kinase n=1 Tax=Dactylosporangium sp. NBC_01737 TaxID=2975959 RepID=UPI002E119487|nr:GAF domain-containing protein [Dactylosporangium sp. NBC_01737]
MEDLRKQSADALTQVAEALSALRHIATLIARGVPSAELFNAVAAELGQLIGTDGANIVRYEDDGTATVVAAWGWWHDVPIPVGTSLSLEGRNVSATVRHTGRPARIDSYTNAPGPLAALLREHGIRSAIGAPVYVEERLWGVVAACTTQPTPLTGDIEARLADYTDLVAAAIASAQAHADLAASRTRVMVTADQARRQIERNLHDGIQQHLVALALQLRETEPRIPSEMSDVRERLSAVTGGLTSVLDDLREISRGIHPAILSEGGLRPALKTLARRCAVPVDVDLYVDGRLPEPVEVAAYYIAAEALANATKHAHATHVSIKTAVHDGWLRLSIADDGVGGADPARGSGLIGLTDRVEALGGTITISSPPGRGTHLQAELPIEQLDLPAGLVA